VCRLGIEREWTRVEKETEAMGGGGERDVVVVVFSMDHLSRLLTTIRPRIVMIFDPANGLV
jgi:hypothetical protein